jgi:hypothetical protein
MKAVTPYVEVPGDNEESIFDDSTGEELRPYIMARSGTCMGMNPKYAVWRFGILKGSEAANAYSVFTTDGFLWVLATRKTGKVKQMWNGFAMDMPDLFRKIIDWEPE